MFLWNVIGMFGLVVSTWAQSPPSTLGVLETFTGKPVQSPAIICHVKTPGRSPASAEQQFVVRYKLEDNFQRIVFRVQNQKITQASLELIENESAPSFFEFITWKTFIPEEGRFQIDLEGQRQFSNMILKDKKPNYMKALEKLGPAVLKYCQRP